MTSAIGRKAVPSQKNRRESSTQARMKHSTAPVPRQAFASVNTSAR